MRGLRSPLLLNYMLLKQKVDDLLEKALLERSDLFVVDFSVGADHHIHITLDGDKLVSVQDCIDISRAIEHNLDREKEDFSLQVSSCGATSPLVKFRQYPKHIGRKIEVNASGEQYKGKLIEAQQECIILEWNERVPKEIGKGKRTITQQQKIEFEHIEKAKVLITF